MKIHDMEIDEKEVEDYIKEKKDPWHKGPFRVIISVFMLLIIVMMVMPYYAIKQDPEPKVIISLSDVNEFILADPNDAVSSLSELRQIVGKGDPQVKFSADKIITRGCKENDVCYAKSLYYFVRDRISYVSDPVGREYIESPLIVLDTGAADCESGSVLLASMMESIGIESQIVVIPGHAFVRVKLDSASGRYKKDGWVYLDWTCSYCEFGEIPYGNMDNMRFMDV